MIEENKLKQFFCGLFLLHRRASSRVGQSFHVYCADCYKTLDIFLYSNISENDKKWLLKKL